MTRARHHSLLANDPRLRELERSERALDQRVDSIRPTAAVAGWWQPREPAVSAEVHEQHARIQGARRQRLAELSATVGPALLDRERELLTERRHLLAGIEDEVAELQQLRESYRALANAADVAGVATGRRFGGPRPATEAIDVTAVVKAALAGRSLVADPSRMAPATVAAPQTLPLRRGGALRRPADVASPPADTPAG